LGGGGRLGGAAASTGSGSFIVGRG
jgi:hypothetical protein